MHKEDMCRPKYSPLQSYSCAIALLTSDFHLGSLLLIRSLLDLVKYTEDTTRCYNNYYYKTLAIRLGVWGKQ